MKKKKALGYPRVLAALCGIACIFLPAGPARGSVIDYVTAYSEVFDGSDYIGYNSINGLTQNLGVDVGATVRNLTTVQSTPSTSVLGSTAASTTLAGSSFDTQTGRTATASTSSYANLATGTIGAGSTSSALSATGRGFAGAGMEDSITFNNTSGHAVNIDVFWTFDGLLPVANVGTRMDTLFCFGTGVSCLGSSLGVFNNPPPNNQQSFSLNDTLLLGLPTDPFITEPTTGWVSAAFTQSINADSGTFHGVFAVPTGISTESLNAYIDLDCQGETCDFTHTGAISFGNLNGVTFTSASGVLLTQSAAPEPGSWILMVAGLSLLGLAKRRKSRTGDAV